MTGSLTPKQYLFLLRADEDDLLTKLESLEPNEPLYTRIRQELQNRNEASIERN